MRDQGILENSARVEFTVKFSHGPKGRRRAREASEEPDPTHATGSAATPLKVASASSVPKIARLLVLGHHFERLVREGIVKDYAEIARLAGLTRARVTQIVNLTLLAPYIQEEILFAKFMIGPRSDISPSERQFRLLASLGGWGPQRECWNQALQDQGLPRSRES
jgi:hypothetical protein